MAAHLTRSLSIISMLIMSGEDLRRRREAADVRQYEVAAEMGVASSRVSQLEAMAQPTADSVTRYMAALARCSLSKSAPAQVVA